MLEERTLNLINADLDGELAPDEKPELRAILESSDEARAMRAELLRLNNLLDSLPEKSPPPGLSRQILDKLAPPPGAGGFSLSGFFQSLQPVATGLAFAAGLLLAVAYYEIAPRPQAAADTSGMVGTMVAGQVESNALLSKDLFLRGDDFSGTLSLRENDGIYILNFDLESTKETEIEVGLSRTGLSFGGFAEVKGDVNKVFDTVAISGGTLRVVNQGRQQFAVFLHENGSDQAIDASSITIDFSAGGDGSNAGVPEET